jgi:general secretion pathway protein K
MTSKMKSKAGKRGSGLIVVLWVVSLLAILVGSFAFDAHIESRITSYYRKRRKAEYLARSGLEIAEMLMAKTAEVRGATVEDEEDQWFQDAKRLSDGLAIRGLVHPLGDGEVAVDIVPEPARRNVNLLTEEDWERIFEVTGVPEERWGDMIDPFYDWIDADDAVRDPQYGAETDDYYAQLDPPYMAKNGPLDTVGELLLVRGFERAVIYGGTLEPVFEGDEPVNVTGVEDILTVYGDGKVNVNAASEKVLKTLPGVDDIVAGAIIEEREGWFNEAGEREDTSFKNVNDLYSRIPGLDPAVRQYTTTDSTIYRVTSVGTVGGVEKRIWCIVNYTKGALTILRWREED